MEKDNWYVRCRMQAWMGKRIGSGVGREEGRHMPFLWERVA